MSKKKLFRINVAIIGSCVSRDIFNNKFNSYYKKYFEVVVFKHQASLMSIMALSVKYKEKKLGSLKSLGKGSIKDKWDKVFLTKLIESQPNVLIVDFFEDARVRSIHAGDTYITLNEHETIKINAYKQKLSNITPFSPIEVQLKERIKAFHSFMTQNLPHTKIVLNQARGVKSYTNIDDKEEFFNQKFVNRLNDNWSKLDQLFIDIVNPIQIDVMTPNIKGNIYHLCSIGYVHYTSNFYYNFLQILISVSKENRIEILKSSLAQLVSTGLFPEEKCKLIEKIRALYISLNTEDKEEIDTWLNGRYKEFISQLIEYNKNTYHYIKFVTYAFGGRLENIIASDLHFVKYMIEPIIKRKLFSQYKISAYAHLNYGDVMYQYFITSKDDIFRAQYFKKALKSLTVAHTQGKTDYLKNRSAYFLSLMYAGNREFNQALDYYQLAIDTDKPVPNIYTLPFLMIMRSVGINAHEIFENINKIFTIRHTKSKKFWLFIQENIDNITIKNHISTFLEKCNYENIKNEKWHTNELIDFMSVVNQYIQLMIHFENDDMISLQSLYYSDYLTETGKANVLLHMANSYTENPHELSKVILMASESNTKKYTKETSQFISNIILENFATEIQQILANNPYTFINQSVQRYMKEISRKIEAWNRFVSRGFVNGYINEEVDFLEFILTNTEDSDFIKVLKTRLAYLYFTGTAEASEDQYKTPNIEKSRLYFRAIKDNPLVKKYLEHPMLSIYQDMEQFLDTKKENYLLFENKKSDELLIVFSCAASHSKYAQLEIFYEKNKTNVLFLNNPTYNWYHGSEWTRIKKTIEEVALKNFKKDNIIAYFGSMGGYAALRTGLNYGFRTIVFNPQVDLNIWMKHHPEISVRLLKEKKLFHLQNMKTNAYEQMPLYYATSSAIEDVEAFSLLIQKLSKCKYGLFIIEKIPDNIHAGIFGHIYLKKKQEAILNIANIQKEYYPDGEYTQLPYRISKKNKKYFLKTVTNTQQLRIMIQLSKGDIYYGIVKNNFLTLPLFGKLDL